MTLASRLHALGAVWGLSGGVATPRRFTSIEAEMAAIRGSIGLSALPHVACLRVEGDGAYDALDRVCPAPMHVRNGTMRHTLLLDEDGIPLVDLYLCNDDDAYLLLAEGLPSVTLIAYLEERFAALAPDAAASVSIRDLGETHALLSLDGPFAWELLAALEGPELVGFPYLSFYHPSPERTYLRAGKTGEFGYHLLVPHAEAGPLWDRLLDAGRPFEIAPVGFDAIDHAMLESWFFSNDHEGALGLSPIELGLQWRLAADKDFVGSEALRARRAAGVTERIAAITSDGPIAAGDPLLSGDEPIGTVLRAARSVTRGDHVAIGLLDVDHAHSGIDSYTALHAGAVVPVRTVSAPFVNNRSLAVNPQRHAFARRAEIAFPPLRPAPRGR
ncbi:MAG: glycine cleavage T C-terminal barrel domain-containing protein [Byssovorax sp.]